MKVTMLLLLAVTGLSLKLRLAPRSGTGGDDSRLLTGLRQQTGFLIASCRRQPCILVCSFRVRLLNPRSRGGPLAVGSVLFSKDGGIHYLEEGSSQRSACSVFWPSGPFPAKRNWPHEVRLASAKAETGLRSRLAPFCLLQSSITSPDDPSGITSARDLSAHHFLGCFSQPCVRRGLPYNQEQGSYL